MAEDIQTQAKPKQKVRARLVPARILIDTNPETGEEYAYLFRGDQGWLNLATEKMHNQYFVDHYLTLYVQRVDFEDEQTMTGEEWRDAGCPKELRIDVNNV